MFAYRVKPRVLMHYNNVGYFWIDLCNYVDGDTRDIENILLLREPDCRFCLYQGKTYRVCQVELDSDEPFIKVWINDPFIGIDGYEQIDESGSGGTADTSASKADAYEA